MRLKAALYFGAGALLAVAASWFYERSLWAGAAVLAIVAALLAVYVLYLWTPAARLWVRMRRVWLPWSYRLTREGLVFMAATGVVSVIALMSGNNLVYLVLSCMLAAVLLSGLVSRLILSGLQLNISLPDHVYARQKLLARITVRNLKRFLPSFSILVTAGPAQGGSGLQLEPMYCPMIAGRSAAAASLEAVFPRRGRFGDEVFWLRTRFPFSFVERRAGLRLARPITVYPAVTPGAGVEEIVRRIRQEALTASPGDSHDLYRIRPAVPGDSARFVHWKASARAGSLLVREFNRQDHARVSLFFDRSIPDRLRDGGEGKWRDEFENAVERCASLAWRLHSEGAELYLVSDDFEINCPPRSEAIFEILRYLALTEPLLSGAAAGRGSKTLPVERDPLQIRIATDAAEAATRERTAGYEHERI